MTNSKSNGQTIIDELRAAGASRAEADQLIALIDDLKRTASSVPNRTVVPTPESLIRRAEQPGDRPWWQQLALAPAGMLIALIAGGATFALAASRSLPGDWLYPVKRTVEQAVVQVLPSQEAAIVLRQSEDIKQSVERRPGYPPTAVTPVLEDIQRAAAHNQLPIEKAKQQQIEHNLYDAQKHATGSVQTAIGHTLQVVKDVELGTGKISASPSTMAVPGVQPTVTPSKQVEAPKPTNSLNQKVTNIGK